MSDVSLPRQSINQLETVSSIFKFDFHLLLTSFNPKTTKKKAAWADEFTSCDRWAEHAYHELHLLEDFSRYANAAHLAAAPTGKRRKISQAKKPQAPKEDPSLPLSVLRSQLTTALNRLVRKFFPLFLH